MKSRIVALLLCALLLCAVPAVAETSPALSRGDRVAFGRYPIEDADAPAPIEWLVLDVDDECALLVSRYVLDCQPFNKTMEVSLTWGNSSLRSWLNGAFYDAAFDSDEKAEIVTAGDLGRVFLLSAEEVETCFKEGYRACEPTPYAQANGVAPAENGLCAYWTRDLGPLPGMATIVESDSLNGFRDAVKMLGVRPAILVKPDAVHPITAEDVDGDDPEALRRQAEAAGVMLPEPAEGEKLYLGAASVPDTRQTRLYLAFVAAPNDMSIRAATLFGEALEVPQEGGDPCRINSQTRTKEDYWILLDADGGTDIGLDEATDMGVYNLRLKDGEGSCHMVVAGHCEKSTDGVDGDYRAEARLTLYDLTGDVAAPAVDPPTVQQARDAGMKVPEPGAGEALYLGAANPSQAETTYVAFVLSEDGARMKNLTVFIRNMDVEYRLGNKRVHTTSSTHSTTSNNDVEVAENMDIGDIHFSGFALNDDGGEAVLRYIFHAKDDNLDYPLDPATVKFARIQ